MSVPDGAPHALLLWRSISYTTARTICVRPPAPGAGSGALSATAPAAGSGALPASAPAAGSVALPAARPPNPPPSSAVVPAYTKERRRTSANIAGANASQALETPPPKVSAVARGGRSDVVIMSSLRAANIHHPGQTRWHKGPPCATKHPDP